MYGEWKEVGVVQILTSKPTEKRTVGGPRLKDNIHKKIIYVYIYIYIYI